MEQAQEVPLSIKGTVSIPERVWGGLERLAGFISSTALSVSIPERVWGGLEPDARNQQCSQFLFQSLRGFGVGWSLAEQAQNQARMRFNP